MKDLPQLGPNPMEPLHRAIIAEARAQALFDIALWLALDGADTPERRMGVLGLLDGIATAPRTWDPFPIDYDPATGEPAPVDLAHQWKLATAPGHRVPLNAIARDAIGEDIKALREFVANPPPEWSESE